MVGPVLNYCVVYAFMQLMHVCKTLCRCGPGTCFGALSCTDEPNRANQLLSADLSKGDNYMHHTRVYLMYY